MMTKDKFSAQDLANLMKVTTKAMNAALRNAGLQTWKEVPGSVQKWWPTEEGEKYVVETLIRTKETYGKDLAFVLWSPKVVDVVLLEVKTNVPADATLAELLSEQKETNKLLRQLLRKAG